MWKVLGILLFVTGVFSREVSNQMKIEGVQYSSPALQPVVHPTAQVEAQSRQEHPQAHPQPQAQPQVVYHQATQPRPKAQVVYHQAPQAPQYEEPSPVHLPQGDLRHYQPHPSQVQPQRSRLVQVQSAVELPVPEPQVGRVVGVAPGSPYPGPYSSHLPPYTAIPYDNSPYPVPASAGPEPYPYSVQAGQRELLRVGGIYAVGPSEEIVEDGPPPGSRGHPPPPPGAYTPFSFGLGGFGGGGEGQVVANSPHPPVAYYSKDTKAYRYNHNQPIHTLGPAATSGQGRENSVVGVTKGVPLPGVVRSVTRGHESPSHSQSSSGHEEYESSPIVMGKGGSPGPRYVLRPQEGPPPQSRPQPHPIPEEYQESPSPYSAPGPSVTYSLGGGRSPPRHLTYSPVPGPPPSGPPPPRHGGPPGGPGPSSMSLMEYLSSVGALRSAPGPEFSNYRPGPSSGPGGLPPPSFLSSGPPPQSPSSQLYEAQPQSSHRRPVTYSFPSSLPPRRHFLIGDARPDFSF